jgi:hypothetical protein
MIRRPEQTAPIFLDRSGRRARRLRRVAYWCIGIVLVLLAVLWLSQAFVVAGEIP